MIKKYNEGTQLYILYSEIKPTNLRVTKDKLSFYGLYKKDVGVIGTIMIIGIILYFSYLSFVYFKQAFDSKENIEKRLPKAAKTKINKGEMADIRHRLIRPLKISASITLVVFCLLVYLGFDEGDFPSLATRSAVISLFLFVVIYLVAYRAPKNY